MNKCTYFVKYYLSYKKGNCVTWRFVTLFLFILSLLCPIIKADPMCDIIGATNIQTIQNQWSCTTTGATTTNPCTTSWSGVGCSGSNIVSINIDSFGVSGMNMQYLSGCLKIICIKVQFHLRSDLWLICRCCPWTAIN